MSYCIYLRKSRADVEAESRGEGETLARHEKALLDLAKQKKLDITKIYKEVVSGETITSRPIMQKLLADVELNIWDGVLVMEVERLARGDTIDQGVVAQTFKYSDTKIITPMKIYDPNNEFDEEYFEFGLFMSRREYVTIKRRLNRGRTASVREGKYVGNKPPYGYKRIRLEKEKGWTLEPVEEESDIVKLIFEWYTTGEKEESGTYKRIGVSLIVRRLNAMKVPTRTGGDWVVATVRDILINPVYIGKIRWNWRPAHKKMVDGQVVVERPRSDKEDCIIVDGLHPAIIDEKVFNAAQDFMSKNPARPIGERGVVKNPLSGIVICGKCGRRMIRRPNNYKNKEDTLMCIVTSCNNVGVALHYVEKRILASISEWISEYKLAWGIEHESKKNSVIEVKQKTLKRLEAEYGELEKQLDNVHTQLERGIYTTEQFLDRSRIINERIATAREGISTIKTELDIEIIRDKTRHNIIPKAEKLIEVYDTLPTPAAKNDMLKDILEKVIYTKEKSGRWHGSPDDFDIVLYPKLPTSTD